MHGKDGAATGPTAQDAGVACGRAPAARGEAQSGSRIILFIGTPRKVPLILGHSKP